MPHSDHYQVAEYRRQAQEIRSIVQKIAVNEAREQLLKTAEHLEGLAEAEERKNHLAGSKPGPAAQE